MNTCLHSTNTEYCTQIGMLAQHSACMWTGPKD